MNTEFGSADAPGPGEQLLTGKIRVDYTVSERGRVRNIRTEAIPEEFTNIQRIVHRDVRRRVFRPRMLDGELQESETMVFEHSFYYRQAELDKLRMRSKKSESAADSSET